MRICFVYLPMSGRTADLWSRGYVQYTDQTSRTGYKVDKLRRNVRNKHRWRATVESHLTFECESNPWQRAAGCNRSEGRARRRHPLFFGIPDMRSMTCNNARVPRPRCNRTPISPPSSSIIYGFYYFPNTTAYIIPGVLELRGSNTSLSLKYVKFEALPVI